MPLFRIKDKIHWFVHVPKCAGQAVESYLETRFGPLAFVNDSFYSLPTHQRWSKSSPQHIDAGSMALLFPAGWIESSFAVVRNPIARVVSAYNFECVKRGLILPGVSLSDWFDEYLDLSEASPFFGDHHLRPQSQIVPEDATVFRLEDGLEPVVKHLDRQAGNSDGPREIAGRNLSDALDKSAFQKEAVPAKTIRRLQHYYAADFNRFGYPSDAPEIHFIYRRRSADHVPWHKQTNTWRQIRRRYLKATGKALT